MHALLGFRSQDLSIPHRIHKRIRDREMFFSQSHVKSRMPYPVYDRYAQVVSRNSINALSISTSAAAAGAPSPSHARFSKTEQSSPHARAHVTTSLVPISPSRLTHGVSKFGRSTTRPALSKRGRDEEETESDWSGSEVESEEQEHIPQFQVRPTEMQPVPVFEGSQFAQVTASRPHPRSTRLKFKLRIKKVGLPDATCQSLKDGARQISLARRRGALSSSSSDDENVLVSRGCSICGGIENPGKVLMCDGCDNEVHMYCMDPPLRSVPRGRFDCPSCMDRAGRAFAISAAAPASCYIADDLDGEMQRVCHGPDGVEISLTANLATNPDEDRKSRRRGVKRERQTRGTTPTAGETAANFANASDALGSINSSAESDSALSGSGPKKKKRRAFFTHHKRHLQDRNQEETVDTNMEEPSDEPSDDSDENKPLSSLLYSENSAINVTMTSDTESEGVPIEKSVPAPTKRVFRSRTIVNPSSAVSIAQLDAVPVSEIASPGTVSELTKRHSVTQPNPPAPPTSLASEPAPSTPTSSLRRTPRLSNPTPTPAQSNDTVTTPTPAAAPVPTTTIASSHPPVFTSRPLRSSAVAPSPSSPSVPAALETAIAVAVPRPRGPGRLPKKRAVVKAIQPPPVVVNMKAPLRRNPSMSTLPEANSPTASSPWSMPGLAALGDSTTQSESTTSSTASSIGAAEVVPVTMVTADFDTPMLVANVGFRTEADGDAMVDIPQGSERPETPSRRPARSAASAANMRMQFGGLSEKQSLKLLHVE